MALSCLVKKMTVSRFFFRGPTFGTTNNLVRSSVVLSNRDSSEFSASKGMKYNFLQNKVKYTLLPSSFGNAVSYSSQAQGRGPVPKNINDDHVFTWKLERITSASLVLLIPAVILMPVKFLEDILSLTILLHIHWGLETIVVDYIRPIIFGNIIPKLCIAFVYVLTTVVAMGIVNLIHEDIGLVKSFIHILKC